MILQVVFGRLLIATGSRAKRINADPLDNISKGLQVGFVLRLAENRTYRWRARKMEVDDGWLRVLFDAVPIGRGKSAITSQDCRTRGWPPPCLIGCASVVFHGSWRPASGKLLLHSPPGHRRISASVRFSRQIRFWIRALHPRLGRYSEACTCNGQG